MAIKAIIFDCFGVLVGKGFEHTYRTAGGDPVKDRAFIMDMLDMANRGLISEPDFHAGMTAKLAISPEAWRQAVQTAESPDKELLGYVQQLRKHYKTAVLSNANKGVMASVIGADWIDKCFDEVVVSAEIGMVKPDTEIYHYVADRLGVEPSECVFLDDREIYLGTARQLGMHGILYRNFPQAKAELEELIGRLAV